jgi:signal transduction histidine kinase
VAEDQNNIPTPKKLEHLIEKLAGRVAELDDEIETLRGRSNADLAAALLAHEVCNILTPGKAIAQMALSRPGDPELAKKALERIVMGIDRTTDIAEVVIEMTEGHPVSENFQTDVLDAAREAIRSLHQDPGSQNITVELKIEPELTAAISGVSLVQVLVNLVSNAVKAISGSDCDGGRIRIEAESGPCSTWNSGAVRLAVIDDGPGIDPVLRDTLFEPFVRTTESRKLGGSGLGLAICRQLVGAVGGELEVSSTPGHGACFSMILPASKISNQAA